MTRRFGGVKNGVQRALEPLGLYARLKSSVVYDWYSKICDPSIIAQRDKEVAFYGETLEGLEPGSLIFDIGANQGFKADMFLRLGARVVAVDPDADNQRILHQRFLRYRIRSKSVIIEPLAVGDSVSTQRMWIDAPGSAKNTLSSKWVETLRADEGRFGRTLQFDQTRLVTTTTLDDLVRKHGEPFFVKIDVEGYEVSVLRGLSAPVRYVSFEVNLPEFADEGRQCVALLSALDAEAAFNYTADPGRGLALPQWLPHRGFQAVFETLADKSVDVFCRSRPRR